MHYTVENETYQQITLPVVQSIEKQLVILEQESRDKLRTRGGVERRRDCSSILYLKDLCTRLLRYEAVPPGCGTETPQAQPLPTEQSPEGYSRGRPPKTLRQQPAITRFTAPQSLLKLPLYLKVRPTQAPTPGSAGAGSTQRQLQWCV